MAPKVRTSESSLWDFYCQRKSFVLSLFSSAHHEKIHRNFAASRDMNLQIYLFLFPKLFTFVLIQVFSSTHFPSDKPMEYISLPNRNTMLPLVPPSDSVAAIYSCEAESQLT